VIVPLMMIMIIGRETSHHTQLLLNANDSEKAIDDDIAHHPACLENLRRQEKVRNGTKVKCQPNHLPKCPHDPRKEKETDDNADKVHLSALLETHIRRKRDDAGIV
jgi:hypothetical protein